MSKFFSNLRIRAKQPYANKNKSFFENYSDHATYLLINSYEKMNLAETRTLDQRLVKVMNELFTLKRLSLFDALRDGHDYFDEVMGATAVPLVGLGICIGNLMLSVWESIVSLSMKMQLVKDDQKNHGSQALDHLLISATTLLISTASLLKSIASMVTRPIVTAFVKATGQYHSQPNSEKRFYDQTGSFQGQLTSVFNEFTQQVLEPKMS